MFIRFYWNYSIQKGLALSLRHEDIICWNNEIHIKYRSSNLNGVRNKTITPNVVQVSNELMKLYSTYVSTLDQNKLTEYVFLNLTTYEAPQDKYCDEYHEQFLITFALTFSGGI